MLIFTLMTPLISLVRNILLKKQYFQGFALKKGPSGGPKRVSITLLRTKLKLILKYPLTSLVTKM